MDSVYLFAVAKAEVDSVIIDHSRLRAAAI